MLSQSSTEKEGPAEVKCVPRFDPFVLIDTITCLNFHQGGSMKKLAAISTAALMMSPTLLLAAKNHPMAGCGLGYVLLSHDDNSKGIQILGATTNNTGTQT